MDLDTYVTPPEMAVHVLLLDREALDFPHHILDDRQFAAAWRAALVPAPADPEGPPPPRRLSWAALLRRVFALAGLSCPRCGGRCRVVAVVTDPQALRRLLGPLGLAPEPPPPPLAAVPAAPSSRSPGGPSARRLGGPPSRGAPLPPDPLPAAGPLPRPGIPLATGRGLGYTAWEGGGHPCPGDPKRAFQVPTRLKAGDVFECVGGGGGGYGDPLDRAPELVMRDVAKGLVS